jgi:hypothetical protein
LLKILYTNGREKETDGKVKFHRGNQPATCYWDFIIEENKNPDIDNLKLVYDTETQESIYFDFCSYRFTNNEKEPHYELLNKAKKDLYIIEKIEELAEPYIEHGDLNIDKNDLAKWIAFNKLEIMQILK